jgi:hypothetical protein
MQRFRLPKSFFGIAALIGGALSAAAQMMDFGVPPDLSAGDVSSERRPSVFQATLDTSYTGPGMASFRGADHGDSDALGVNLGVSTRLPLGRRWMLPFDFRLQHMALGAAPGALMPGDIRTAHLGLGLGYRAGERWMLMARADSMLYRLDEVDGNDVGFGGGLMALWRPRQPLQVIFGALAFPDSDLPVLPMVGIDWWISSAWELRLMFPRPRLIYHLDEHWRLQAGLDVSGATFRGGDSLGASLGLSQYGNAIGTYRDIRLAVGGGWRANETFSIELEGGYSVSRRIDYQRIDEQVDFEPAPFVRLELRAAF